MIAVGIGISPVFGSAVVRLPANAVVVDDGTPVDGAAIVVDDGTPVDGAFVVVDDAA